MPGSRTLRVEVSSEILADVEAAIHAGEYKSATEIVGEALRSWSSERALENNVDGLRVAVSEALADNHTGVDAYEMLDRLEAEYRSKADSAKARECV